MSASSMAPIQFGDTFVMGQGGHLWIVISDPTRHSGNFIIANLTTDKRRAGTDCELNKGDHPWITQKCFVNFGDAREVTPEQEAQLILFMNGGYIQKNFPMDLAILEKITIAAKTSRAIAIGLRKYF